MRKRNCWEVVGCGREQGGDRADTHGICAAAVDTTADGINGGVNGGRICWAIAGTDCRGSVAHDDRHKLVVCERCVFYEQVLREEGLQDVQLSRPGHLAD